MKKIIFLLLFSYIGLLPINAQQNPEPGNDAKALALLDNAIGKTFQKEKLGIVFEGISYGLREPLAIFTVPAYEVVRGGFLFVDGDKYELQLGSMKGMSNGKIMVMIDEVSKTMFVDSVRKSMPADFGSAPDIEKMWGETFGKASLSYEKQETVNGKVCHKIKASFNDEVNTHVYYWVTVSTGQLYVMSEWQGNGYDTYWFSKIGEAPAKHDYSIHLPQKEIENYYGYEVIDNRFAYENLSTKK